MSSDRLVLHIYLEPEVVRLCAPLNTNGTLHRCCGLRRGLLTSGTIPLSRIDKTVLLLLTHFTHVFFSNVSMFHYLFCIFCGSS